jgi:hypothetical protein
MHGVVLEKGIVPLSRLSAQKRTFRLRPSPSVAKRDGFATEPMSNRVGRGSIPATNDCLTVIRRNYSASLKLAGQGRRVLLLAIHDRSARLGRLRITRDRIVVSWATAMSEIDCRDGARLERANAILIMWLAAIRYSLVAARRIRQDRRDVVSANAARAAKIAGNTKAPAERASPQQNAEKRANQRSSWVRLSM